MKIALVSLYFDPNAMAIRLLSSILKRDFPGDEINIVLLSHKFKPPRMDFDLETAEDLQAIQDFFAREQFDIVGISLMTNYLERAVQLTQAIRQVSSSRILWGGIHPTLCPEECVQYADIVFVGEAELSLPEVVRRLKNGEPLSGMPGIWSRENGQVAGHGTCPPCLDLDSLPLPDYDFATQFIFSPEERQVVPMRAEYFNKTDWIYTDGKPFHRVMTARGCSQACNYCINATYKKLLGLDKLAIRKRSLKSVMHELELAKNLGIFQKFMFVDDDILLRSPAWLKEFSEIYPERIGLPFVCQVTAGRVTAEKIRYLKKAGVSGINMGVQSGSDRLNYEIFNRKISRTHVLQASRIIHEVGGMNLGYDFLVRNPYESLDDKFETVMLLLELPTPFSVRTYALTFFPGMPLTERARQDGIIMEEIANSIYDYNCSLEEQEWKEVLEILPKHPTGNKQQLMKHLQLKRPRSIKELIALAKGDEFIESDTGIKPGEPVQLKRAPTHWAALLSSPTPDDVHLKLLWQQVRIVFPKVQMSDYYGALFAAWQVNANIKGRHCGDIGDKVAQYLSVAQYARETNSREFDNLEIGTLFGGSCLMKLFAMRDLGILGKVICIDPMSGYYGQEVDTDSQLPVTEEIFFENIRRFGFSKAQVELRAYRSDQYEAIINLPTTLGTIMIDGDHSYEGIAKDCSSYIQFLSEDGVLLFDDYAEPGWPDITRFIDTFNHNLPSDLRETGILGTTICFSKNSSEDITDVMSSPDDKTGIDEFVFTYIDLTSDEVLQLRSFLKKELNDLASQSVLANLGTIYAGLGEYERAKNYFSQSLRLYSGEHIGFKALTSFADFCKKQGLTQDAIKYYLKALSVTKNDIVSTGWISVRLGILYYEQKLIIEARELLSKAHNHSALNPSNKFLCLLYLANCALSDQQLDDAISLYKECLAVNAGMTDKYADVTLKLGGIFQGLGREAEAEVYYRSALAKNKLNHHNHFLLCQRLGDLLLSLGDLVGAKECFEQAILSQGISEQEQLAVMAKIAKYNAQVFTLSQGNIPDIDKKYPHQSIRHLRSADKLLPLKNLYVGERAFILGNGPSLNSIDFTLLKDEITFGTNSIFYNFDNMGFKPTFYVVEDKLVAEDRAAEINSLTGMTKIFGEYLKYCINDSEETIWTNVIFDFSNYPGFPHFSKDASKCLWVGGTVSYLCMQLAYYMGFKEVYLLGFDHNYVIPADAIINGTEITSTSSDINHFHPDYFGKGKRWHDPKTDRMELAYQKALDAFKADDRRIYNITTGGKLDIFPRLSFQSVFDKRSDESTAYSNKISCGNNICKACSHKALDYKTAFNKKWYKCTECDFLQADISLELINHLKLGEGFSAGTGLGGGGHREFFLSQMCTHNLNARNILLYGTGNTNTLETLLNAGFDAYGCDYSKDLIVDRQNRFGPDRFFHPDAIPDILFDAIVAVEVFEHFDSPLDQVGKLMRCLSKRGVITGTTDLWDGSDISNHIYLKPNLHVAYWSNKSMTTVAHKFGHNCKLFELICPGSITPDEKYGLLWPRKRVFNLYPDIHVEYFDALHKYLPVLPIDKP